MATAPAPATISTAWRSGSRKDTVASVNSSSPASSTSPTGRMALSCQLKRMEPNRMSSRCDEPRDDEPVENTGSLPPGTAKFDADWGGLSIGMQSGQQVGHAKESEHHHGKAGDGEVSGATATPSARDA